MSLLTAGLTASEAHRRYRADPSRPLYERLVDLAAAVMDGGGDPPPTRDALVALVSVAEAADALEARLFELERQDRELAEAAARLIAETARAARWWL